MGPNECQVEINLNWIWIVVTITISSSSLQDYLCPTLELLAKNPWRALYLLNSPGSRHAREFVIRTLAAGISETIPTLCRLFCWAINIPPVIYALWWKFVNSRADKFKRQCTFQAQTFVKLHELLKYIPNSPTPCFATGQLVNKSTDVPARIDRHLVVGFITDPVSGAPELMAMSLYRHVSKQSHCPLGHSDRANNRGQFTDPVPGYLCKIFCNKRNSSHVDQMEISG